MEPTNSDPFEIEVIGGVAVARGRKKPGRSTGSQRIFSVAAILICLILLEAAWWSTRATESVCVVEGRGVSGHREGAATSVVNFRLSLGNDRFWPAHVWQSHPSWAEAEAAIAEYLPQAKYPCWYQPLFPTYVTLLPDQRPAAFLFWGLMAALFFVNGFSLANLLSIVAAPRTSPPGRHLPYRLAEEGGGIGPVFWFMVPMLLFGVGVIYALVQLFRSLWPLPGDDPYFFRIVTLVFLGLALAGSLGLLAWIGKYLYRLFIRSRTELEIEAQPLKPGQKVRVHVKHEAGRLPTESLRLSLVSFEMTNQKHRSPHSQTGRYSQQIHRRDNIAIGGQDHLDKRPSPVWEGDFFLTVPATAKPTLETGFPQIRWEIKLQVKVARGPDFEVNFPVTIVEA